MRQPIHEAVSRKGTKKEPQFGGWKLVYLLQKHAYKSATDWKHSNGKVNKVTYDHAWSYKNVSLTTNGSLGRRRSFLTVSM